jgi:hypothetical protein
MVTIACPQFIGFGRVYVQVQLGYSVRETPDGRWQRPVDWL